MPPSLMVYMLIIMNMSAINLIIKRSSFDFSYTFYSKRQKYLYFGRLLAPTTCRKAAIFLVRSRVHPQEGYSKRHFLMSFTITFCIHSSDFIDHFINHIHIYNTDSYIYIHIFSENYHQNDKA